MGYFVYNQSMKKALLFIGGIIFALFLAEFALRLFLPQQVYSTRYKDRIDCYVPHPVYFVELKKNTSCLYALPNKEYATETKSNNLGFRENTPTKTAKPPGTKRIVFIGDSFTFGQGVQSQDAFPKIVGKKLLDTQIPAETINAGIIGAGPAWYYLTLKEKIIPLKPDIVVVNLYLGNDLSDLDYFSWKEIDADGLPGKITTTYEYIDQDGSRRFANTPLRYRVPFFRESHLALFLIKTVLGNLTENTKEIAFSGSPCYLNPGCNDYAKQEKKLKKLVLGMRRITDKNNIQLLVVLIPWELQMKRSILEQSGIRIIVSGQRRHLLSNRIESMLKENGIETVDLLPSLDAYSGNEQIIYPKDRHWTKEGHRIAAEAITDMLQKTLKTKNQEIPSPVLRDEDN